MTEAMPFLQKAILLSYAPRPFRGGLLFGYYQPTASEDPASSPLSDDASEDTAS